MPRKANLSSSQVDGGANEQGLLTFLASTTFALQPILPDMSCWYSVGQGPSQTERFVLVCKIIRKFIIPRSDGFRPKTDNKAELRQALRKMNVNTTCQT